MISQDFSNLTDKILIASPYTMEDNIFHQSIVYVVHHGDQGAVGFLVNRLVKNPPVNNLFKKAEFKLDLNLLNLKIHIGGPLEFERAFFLHSAEYNKNLLFKLENSEGWRVIDILSCIFKRKETETDPDASIICTVIFPWGNYSYATA